MENKEFCPVIIGTDTNTYGVARAFHMEYGIKSKVFGSAALLMVAHSQICDTTVVKKFSDDQVMLDTLLNYAKEHSDKDLILFAASEQYAFRIMKNYQALSEFYLIPYTKPELGLTLTDKAKFYDLCEKAQLPYPKTEIIHKKSYRSFQTNLAFPLVLKPSESTDYFSLDFEAKEKTYIIKDHQDLKKTVDLIYEAGYDHDLLVQDYVPGEITNEYVLNTYSDQEAKVRLMSLGNILIDDPDPELRGNYVAIINPDPIPEVKELYAKVKDFLESISFTGLANFDFKYDELSKEFKVFEINIRQGRSSFFSVLAGVNFAKSVVEDLIYDQQSPIVIGDKDFIWLNCTEEGFFQYIKDHNPQVLDKVKNIKNRGNSLEYDKDKSIKRTINIKRYLKRYSKQINNE